MICYLDHLRRLEGFYVRLILSLLLRVDRRCLFLRVRLLVAFRFRFRLFRLLRLLVLRRLVLQRRLGPQYLLRRP